ncbi:MAG TPA: DUF4350 domain-containing protein [Anaeromyxobacter sp.]
MSEAGGGSFGRRGAGWLAAVAAASLGAAAFLGVFGDALYDPPSFAPDSFSRSAVGHRAFVELLRALGHPVIVSRHRTPEKVGDAAVMLVEPRLGPGESPRQGILEEVNESAHRLLVVLPKRGALPDPMQPRFVAFAGLLPLEDAQRILDALAIEAKVVRPDGPVATWRGELPAPTLDKPQLVTSTRLQPLVASDEGLLAGEIVVEGWHTVVLADPDVLATHGLARGDNAALAAALVDRLAGGALPLVVDETLHGFDQQPSIARELLRFPLVLATASALLAMGLLAWAALVRFGRASAPQPLLGPGKLFLVDSTAALLRHGGGAGHAAAAYLRAAKDEIAHRLRPPGETGETDAWVARVAEARGRGAHLREAEERVRRLGTRRKGGEEEAVRTAQIIHRLREEMTDGAHGDPRRDGAAQG